MDRYRSKHCFTDTYTAVAGLLRNPRVDCVEELLSLMDKEQQNRRVKLIEALNHFNIPHQNGWLSSFGFLQVCLWGDGGRKEKRAKNNKAA